MSFYLINLTTYGSPYIIKHFTKKDTTAEMEAIQKCVGGFFESFDKKDLRIHPVFNGRWKLIDPLLKRTKTKVFVNEDGMEKCSPNMATIITNPYKRLGGCPHLLGDVCIKVMEDDMKKTKTNPDWLTLVRDLKWFIEKHDRVEIDDDEDGEALEKECEEKEYDYEESAGQVFKCKYENE